MGGVVGDLQPQFLSQMYLSLVSCTRGSGKAVSLLALLPKHEEKLALILHQSISPRMECLVHHLIPVACGVPSAVRHHFWH